MEFITLMLLLGQLWTANVVSSASREDLVREAIQEAQLRRASFAVKNSQSQAQTSAALLNAFKRASVESLQEGNKQLMFEDMIKKAERKILENERKARVEENMKSPVETQAEELARELVHKAGSILNKDEIAKIHQESECAPLTIVPNCSTAKAQQFRTVNGVCNNLQDPLKGSARTPFSRLIQAQYEDGLSQLRGSMQNMENSLLSEGPFNPPNPSPRLISLSVVRDRPTIDERYSHLMMQWGQFLDHDIDLAPAFKAECSGCNTEDERCAPFRIPTDDPTFGDSKSSQLCHPFVRSLPVCDQSLRGHVNPRQQVNELTSFIDGSQIYGSSEKVMNAIRRNGTGRLRIGPNIPAYGEPSLPVDETGKLVECLGGMDCFLAGDVRVNEQPGLIIMHTIWMREHNRIANELARLNPDWDGEMVFQVTRQIVGAELQKITFQDYLPLLLGNGFELISNFSYNINVNPSIPNAFATAAFRFGHSQVHPLFERLNKNFEPLSIGPLNLLDSFFKPSQYAASRGTDPILRGLLTRQARRTDEFVNDVLTNHLFQTNSSSHGMDLASLNIQRGRDHGLPPYMTWKRWAERQCGVTSDFDSDLTLIRLLQTYGTLETVDLWVGGLAEKPLPGGAVGATFACIFAKTFSALRNGDRFYYENSDLANATFTSEQRAAINNASLSRVICDNADNVQEIQPNAFRGDQPRVSCNSLPMVDLTAWMDPCYVRVTINSQMMDVDFLSVSVPQISWRRSGSIPNTVVQYNATIPRGETSVCLPFVCPIRRNRVTLTVSILNSNPAQQCSVVRRGRLPWNLASLGSTYIGNIRTRNLRRNRGLYRNMDTCERPNSVTGLQFTCRSPDLLSKDALVLQELANELHSNSQTQTRVQTLANKLFGKEISITDPIIPKEVQTLLQDKAFIQKLYLEEDDVDEEDYDYDEGVVSESMDSVVGLLQSAIKQLKDMESTRSEEKTMSKDREMAGKNPPDKEQAKSHNIMPPSKDVKSDSLAKLVGQLQNAVDQFDG